MSRTVSGLIRSVRRRDGLWGGLPRKLLYLLFTVHCSLFTGLAACSRGTESYKLDEDDRKAILQSVQGETENREPRTENRESRAENRERRTESGERESLVGRLSEDREELLTRATPSVTLRAEGLPLRMALERLALQAEWSIRWDEGVEPEWPVTADVSEIPFHLAVDTLVSQAGYTTEFDFTTHAATVRKYVERVFYLPEIWARRPLPLPGSGGGVFVRYAEDPGTAVQNAIRSFLSPQGKVFVDPISGTVIVRDEHQHVRMLDRYFRQIEAESREPWLVEVAILVASPGKEGISWDKVAERVGVGRILPAGPLEAEGKLKDGELDVAALFLDALQPEKARLVSRPQVAALNGWTVQMSVASAPGSQSTGWELWVTPHQDYSNVNHVVVELAGGVVDRLTQRFSTTSTAEIGQPLIVSTGVGTAVEKGWVGEDSYTQQAVFVVTVRRAAPK